MNNWKFDRSFVFNTPSILFLVITVCLAVFGRDWSTGRSGIIFLSAIFCAFVANIDKFESLRASLSGITAKTREVNRVVDEAKAVLAELHSLKIRNQPSRTT
jgi:hypothetical protein